MYVLSRKHNFWHLYLCVKVCILYVLVWEPYLVCMKSRHMHRQLFNVCPLSENRCVNSYRMNVLPCKRQFVHDQSPCACLGYSIMYLVAQRCYFMQIRRLSCSVHCVIILVQDMKHQFKYFWGAWVYKEYVVRYLHTRKHQLIFDMICTHVLKALWGMSKLVYVSSASTCTGNCLMYVQSWKLKFVHNWCTLHSILDMPIDIDSAETEVSKQGHSLHNLLQMHICQRLCTNWGAHTSTYSMQPSKHGHGQQMRL